MACEKPLAVTLADARKMALAVEAAGVANFVWFGYRRAPAVALARQLIDEGRIGKIYHFRATFLQDWIMDPKFPLVWRLRKEVSGSGAHGDLGAHLIDIAHYLVGPIESVVGHMETFIKTRPLEAGRVGPGLGGKASTTRTGQVTVDDATMFLSRFASGALGTFESTRFAKGRRSHNGFEINGSKGSLVYNFEQMNELEYYNAEDPPHVQGFRTIQVTESVHPYAGAWWPAGHIIGYEHTFINQLSDMIVSLCAPALKRDFHPDFQDGLQTQEVLDAVERSHKTRKWVSL